MEFTEKDFQILDTLDRRSITTQRELAEHAGVSLGQVNYVLKSLLEKGLVKIGNFRKNPRKIGYVYHLTPKGFEAKSALAAKFVVAKLSEYHDLRQRLAERLAIIGKKGYLRIVFVGPFLVGGLLDSIIREKGMNLLLVDQCAKPQELKELNRETFDAIILFDAGAVGLKNPARDVGISPGKVFPLL